MKKIGPVYVIDLFPIIDQQLISLLRALSAKDWQRPTISPSWNIYDISLHLLDGNLRGISTGRDKHFGILADDIDTYGGLVAFLNQLNHDWVQAGQRISPPLLIDLLEMSNQWYHEHLRSLNMAEEAIFSVAWAGEHTSANWFHVAREYTEKYHHQLQIRQALGKEESLLAPKLYTPFMDTLIRALPHHFAKVKADTGTTILIEVSGAIGQWFLIKYPDHWALYQSCDIHPASTVKIDKKIAWRLFTKGIHKKEALKYIDIEGQTKLGEKILEVVAIMA